MKRITFFSTRLWVYLFDLPIIALLTAALLLQRRDTSLLRFIPLEILLFACIIMLPVYFFRAVTVSRDEVRDRGFFSARDRAVMNRGKTLILTLSTRRRLGIALFGNDGQTPALDWLKNDPNYVPMDIYLFRANTLGGRRRVRRLLTLLDLSGEDADALLSLSAPIRETDTVRATVEKKNEICEIRLYFKETLL